MIKKHYGNITVIFALDLARKDIEDYKTVTRDILDTPRLVAEHVIEVDSVRFWGGEKNALLPAAREALKPIVGRQPANTVYFGNCLTNPVALALKRFAPVNHLYHAPGDFVSMLFPVGNPWKTRLKNLVKRVLGRELYMIEPSDLPIFSLLNFKAMPRFAHVDFRDFDSAPVRAKLAGLIGQVTAGRTHIMLLLAGDEPEPGDKNPSNIEKYLPPHLQVVRQVMEDDGISVATVWCKEHRSYLPLTPAERSALTQAFAGIGCDVRFVADYLTPEYRFLPGECILSCCPFSYIVAEPSSFLLNVAEADITPVMAVSAFAPYRDANQQGRNAEFVAINKLLTTSIRIY